MEGGRIDRNREYKIRQDRLVGDLEVSFKRKYQNSLNKKGLFYNQTVFQIDWQLM